MKKGNVMKNYNNLIFILFMIALVIIFIFSLIRFFRKNNDSQPNKKKYNPPEKIKSEEPEYKYGCGDKIPVVGVIGGNGKTFCVDLIANIMRSRYNVGRMNKNGITIDNACKNDKSKTVKDMIIDDSVDAAVVGLSCNYIGRSGLGFNKCDVGIFLNNREASGKMGYHNLLYRHICENGCAVINCDDKYYNYLKKMMPLMKCKIIYFSYDKKSKILKDAIKNNDPVIYYDDSNIVYKDEDNKYVFNAEKLDKRVDIEAMMGAIGCCVHMDFNIDEIKRACRNI